MRSDILPAARFPDYELLDHEGIARRLSDLQAGQPMILVLARGHWRDDLWRDLRAVLRATRDDFDPTAGAHWALLEEVRS